MRSAVKHRLKVSYDDVRKVNPQHRLRQHQRLRPDRPLRQARRRRPDRAGHGRAHVRSPVCRAGPVRVGVRDRRSHRRQPAGARDHDGALRSHPHRRRPLGAHESARSAGLHAGFPGGALADGREVAKQAGNDHPTGIPTGVFPTSDGHFNIAAASERVWERICDAIGKSEWKAKPEWHTQTRSADRELNAAIGEITRHKPSAHWVELFEEAGVPCGPIYSIDQVFADPQVQHLGMAAPVTSKKRGIFNSSLRRSIWKACGRRSARHTGSRGAH